MGNNFNRLELGVIIGCCMTAVLLLCGTTTAVTAARVKCQDNLKRIGAALNQYAEKNNGMLCVVNNRDNWRKIWCLDNPFVKELGLKPQLGVRAKGNVLECPGEEKKETFSNVGYVMNVNLHVTDSKRANLRRGGKLADFSMPETTIAATDGAMHLLDVWKSLDNKENVTRPRHEGKLNVLMLDGHVTSVDKLLSNLTGYHPTDSWFSDEDR
jgi:prepilin-type processing-associated H-X9-DG protein